MIHDRQHSGITVFILDMEHDTREMVRRWMADEGYRILVFQDAPTCLEAVNNAPPDVLLADVLTASLAGVEIVEKTLNASNDTLVVLMYQQRLADNARQSVFRGAFDFIPKPLDRVHLTLAVKNAAKMSMLESENRQLRSDMSRRRRSSLPAFSASAGLSMKELERKAIKDALTLAKGNVSKAARTLGLGRTTLYRKMSAFGLSDFRGGHQSSLPEEAEQRH